MKKKTTTEDIPQLEGYKIEKKTISMLKANILALAVAVIGIALMVVMFAVWDGMYSGMRLNSLSGCSLLLIAIVVGIAVHELIHGFTWMVVTRQGFGHLRFGLLTGGVYCHIDVPMSKRRYVIGALMPLLLMGVVPFMLSIALHNLWLMLFGVIFIASAMGDVMIVWALRKETPDTLVYDHPSEPGCFVYHPIA